MRTPRVVEKKLDAWKRTLSKRKVFLQKERVYRKETQAKKCID